MTKKLIEVVIDRKKWGRGVGDETSRLYNPYTRKMCCLGFVCKTAGIPVAQFSGISTPSDLRRSLEQKGKKLPPILKKMTGPLNDRCVTSEMIGINDWIIDLNDDMDIQSEAQREHLLTKLALKLGLKFKFVN